MTTHKNRPLMRLAVAIHEQLHIERFSTARIELPAATWQQCKTLVWQLSQAQRRDWQLAANRVERDLRNVLHRLKIELSSLDHFVESSQIETHPVVPRDIYAELVALHDEFDQVAFDRRGRTISVTTEPIELEGVYLGPFEIRLDWGDLTDGHPDNYRVIALDANPAAVNEVVTHPHVQDEAVCEGDGHQPIRQALREGRLLDFFVIVANVLRTYNSSSPFVSLLKWHGVECADCGTTSCDDVCRTCERCDASVCDECYVNCPGCDGVFCNECATSCQSCYQYHCLACINRCARCGDMSCKKCLHENERCSDCHEQETEDTKEKTGSIIEGFGPGRPDAPLQPDHLGQAAVPA